MSEGMVVNACIRWLYANGCYVWRNNTGALPDKTGRLLRYGKKGSADIIGVTRNGRFIGVECKWGKGEMSPPQEEFRRAILEKCGLYILARNSCQALEDMKDIILADFW